MERKREGEGKRGGIRQRKNEGDERDGGKKGAPKKESIKLSGRFSKYAAVTMFLNYHYCYRAAIPVKRVRSPRHRDNNNRARL